MPEGLGGLDRKCHSLIDWEKVRNLPLTFCKRDGK